MANLNYIRHTETYIDGVQKYHFTVQCPECKTTQVVSVGGPELHAYHNGEGLLQNLFPYLTADQREALFQTGLCSKCWAALWGEEEE